jgi:hypothetical protein
MLIAGFNPLEKHEHQIGSSSQLYQLLGMPVHHSCSKAPSRMAIFHGYSMAISPWRPEPPVVGLADRDPALCRRQHRSAAETSKAAADQNHVLKRPKGPWRYQVTQLFH